MGISALTALEIFSNPRDLHVAVGETDGKFAFMISRGPGHDFKPILSSRPFAENVPAVIGSIKEILESVCNYCRGALSDPGNTITRMLNPGGRPIDEVSVLTQSIIDWMVGEIALKNEVCTSEMSPT